MDRGGERAPPPRRSAACGRSAISARAWSSSTWTIERAGELALVVGATSGVRPMTSSLRRCWLSRSATWPRRVRTRLRVGGAAWRSSVPPRLPAAPLPGARGHGARRPPAPVLAGGLAGRPGRRPRRPTRRPEPRQAGRRTSRSTSGASAPGEQRALGPVAPGHPRTWRRPCGSLGDPIRSRRRQSQPCRSAVWPDLHGRSRGPAGRRPTTPTRRRGLGNEVGERLEPAPGVQRAPGGRPVDPQHAGRSARAARRCCELAVHLAGVDEHVGAGDRREGVGQRRATAERPPGTARARRGRRRTGCPPIAVLRVLRAPCPGSGRVAPTGSSESSPRSRSSARPSGVAAGAGRRHRRRDRRRAGWSARARAWRRSIAVVVQPGAPLAD